MKQLVDDRMFISLYLEHLRGAYDRQYGRLMDELKRNEVIRDEIESVGLFVHIGTGTDTEQAHRVNESSLLQLGLCPANVVKKIFDLAEEQCEAEHGFLIDSVLAYAHRQGLEKHISDIVDGINQTSERVIIYQDTSALGDPTHFSEVRQVMLHDTSAVLTFALDYVDKWKMYNDLFGKERRTKSPRKRPLRSKV